ncbi:MAG: sodium:solute symporter [Bacteroidota bacterium]
MHLIDWIVMLTVLFSIILYGIWKTRNVSNVKSYLLGDKDLPWWTIGLSVMATQASAITFLSTPGQAYEEGMGFAQFYFGIPIAMVFLCIFVLPIYYKLDVYTAYEYLEHRFDLKTRKLTAILFLIQRGLAAGITIFAPSIILSSILGWSLVVTTLFIGVLVITYTVFGGTKAVSVTQKQQMIVILLGMLAAAVILVTKLPTDVSFSDAVSVAGKMGKLEVVNFEFDITEKYNIWSGMIAAVFLFMSYFGTDQSQVQRYLSGKSLTESRLGLLFNGIVKVPMQFMILFVGILVFMFFQFQQPPLHFNQSNVEAVNASAYQADYQQLESRYDSLFTVKETEIRNMITAIQQDQEGAIQQSRQRLDDLLRQDSLIRSNADQLIVKANNAAETQDADYVFITFVTRHLPVGLIGLLLAVIFSAAMSSTSSELNALATTTVIDIYKRTIAPDRSDQHYLRASMLFTIMWGIMALCFAMAASLFDNLIEAVNIIGSVFYGAILGIFLTAFFLKKVGSNAVFVGALLAEAIVVTIFILEKTDRIDIAYLWLNLIGCVLVLFFSWLFQQFFKQEQAAV